MSAGVDDLVAESTVAQPPIAYLPEHLWNALPGWGIGADLTPPELIAARRLRTVRRRVVAALLVLVLVCAGGYGFAAWRTGVAAGELAAEQARTAALQSEANKYAVVTRVQGATTTITTQIGQLMADDVDLAALLAALQQKLPTGMTISEVSTTVGSGGAGAGSARQAGGAVSIDASGLRHIGTVTISGASATVADLPAFLDGLSTVAGLTAVLPLTNETSVTGVRYSLQATLTDALLTRRYDKGAK